MKRSISRRQVLAVAGMASLAGCSNVDPSGATPRNGTSPSDAGGVPEYGLWVPDHGNGWPIEYVNHDVAEEIVDQLPRNIQTKLKYRDEQTTSTPAEDTESPTPLTDSKSLDTVRPTFQVRISNSNAISWPVPTVTQDEFHGFIRHRMGDGELLIVLADIDVDEFDDAITNPDVKETGTAGEATIYELTGKVIRYGVTIPIEFQFAVSPSYLAVLGAGYGDVMGAGFEDINIEEILNVRNSPEVGLSDESTVVDELLSSLGRGDHSTFVKYSSALERQEVQDGLFEGTLAEGRRVRFSSGSVESRLALGFKDEELAEQAVTPVENSVRKHRTEDEPEDLEDLKDSEGYGAGSFNTATSHSVGRERTTVYVDASYPIQEVGDAMTLYPFR